MRTLHVTGCFSICFGSMYELNKVQFFFSRTAIFFQWKKAFNKSQHGFLRSEKMFILVTFNTLGVWVLLSAILWTLPNSYHIVMAGVVAIALCWQMLCLRFVAHVITTLCCCVVWQMESHYGRCYSLVCQASGRYYCHRWQME